LGLKAWKPDTTWKPVTEELIKEALEIVLNVENHPVMVTCTYERRWRGEDGEEEEGGEGGERAGERGRGRGSVVIYMAQTNWKSRSNE
jgi:hypothetical protein